MRSIALGRWPRAIEHIELFPAPRGKYSVLLTSQTLNNCIISRIKGVFWTFRDYHR